MLVFDIIYVEGQCCYVELFSVYVRQFLGLMEKFDVDSIIGFLLVIFIDQKMISYNLCSMVGIVIEIYDYLCLFYVCVGMLYCFICGCKIEKQSFSEVIDCLLVGFFDKCVILFVLVVCGCKGEYKKLFVDL